MLADRPYMRDDAYLPRWRMSSVLMVTLVAVFVLVEILGFYGGIPVLPYLALSADGLKHGCIWQLFTFQFLHAGLMHLLFNLLGIWFFGRFIEDRLGAVPFLRIYFLGGLAGGLLQAFLGLLAPRYFGLMTVGASAGVLALLAAFCALEPDGIILLFFVLPVKARLILYVSLGIAAFFTLVPSDPGVAHAAHLGGMLAGLAYLRWWRELEGSLKSLQHWNPIRGRIRKKQLVKAATLRSSPWQAKGARDDEELPPGEFISREVDPILDKISAHGIHSLTERERKILEAARSRMGRR